MSYQNKDLPESLKCDSKKLGNYSQVINGKYAYS